MPTALAVQQAQRANQAEQQQQALADLLTDPSAVVVHGDVTGGGAATAILTDDRALFSATGLPDPGDGKAYQLWIVDAEGAASVGVLADDAGTVRQVADDFTTGDALAITIEPAAGSTQPTTDPLVVLTSHLTAAPHLRHPRARHAEPSSASATTELAADHRARPRPSQRAPPSMSRRRPARPRPPWIVRGQLVALGPTSSWCNGRARPRPTTVGPPRRRDGRTDGDPREIGSFRRDRQLQLTISSESSRSRAAGARCARVRRGDGCGGRECGRVWPAAMAARRVRRVGAGRDGAPSPYPARGLRGSSGVRGAGRAQTDRPPQATGPPGRHIVGMSTESMR